MTVIAVARRWCRWRVASTTVPALAVSTKTYDDAVPIAWSAVFGRASGYADEARAAALALDAAGHDIVADPLAWTGWEVALAGGTAERLERLVDRNRPPSFVHVIHATAESFYRHPAAIRSIGRTMFETDRIPEHWVSRCNALDEIWVPSAFNVDSFARAGVDRDRLVRLPGLLGPGFERTAAPLSIPGARGFVFLGLGVWEARKGWDLLLRAYVEEFGPHDAVTLVVAVPPADVEVAEVEVTTLVTELTGRPRTEAPRVLLVPLALSDRDLPRLYRAADAFVLASRGEGWGRPYMEAMASGLPTIGTRWSGNLDFMHDGNAFLIDCRLVEVEPGSMYGASSGHRWAEPSIPHLRELLRRVATDERDARRRAHRARTEVFDGYTQRRFAERVGKRLGSASSRARPRRHEPLRLVWDGDQFVEHSLATVNRGLVRALLGTGRVEVDLRCEVPDDASRWPSALVSRVGGDRATADVEVRHRWPPLLHPIPGRRVVVGLPWEWGSLPRAWVDPLSRGVDEVWVPSRFVRDTVVGSGVPAERVAVVANGVDPLRFHPHQRPLLLPTGKRTRFLFVGGAIRRKGADIALRAYVDAFDRHDDVCLVVTDIGADSFYRGQSLRDEIRSLQHDVRTPEILYLGDSVPDASMPALYAACHCLLAPYRAEGFGLPIVEAMACGLAVVVTDHGPAPEFVGPDRGYLVAASVERGPEAQVAGLETVAPPTWAEVDRDVLVETIRQIAARPAEAAAVGARAAEWTRSEMTWNRSADVAIERVEALIPRRVRRRRRRPTVATTRRGSLSGCTIVRDAVRLRYPLEASLLSYLPVCDEVVVAFDRGGDDGTADLVADLAREHRPIRSVPVSWDGTVHDVGREIGRQTNAAIAACRSEWVLSVQADEAVHEDDHPALRRVVQDPECCGGRFDRRMFLGSLDREISAYRSRGLLRLFRQGSAWATGDAMTCALVPAEGRRVVDDGWRLFDYGRVGDADTVVARKRALQAFYHTAPEDIGAALADELRQATVPFDPLAHPAPVQAHFSAVTSSP